MGASRPGVLYGYAAVELPLTVTPGIDQEGLEIRLTPDRGAVARVEPH